MMVDSPTSDDAVFVVSKESLFESFPDLSDEQVTALQDASVKSSGEESSFNFDGIASSVVKLSQCLHVDDTTPFFARFDRFITILVDLCLHDKDVRRHISPLILSILTPIEASSSGFAALKLLCVASFYEPVQNALTVSPDFDIIFTELERLGQDDNRLTTFSRFDSGIYLLRASDPKEETSMWSSGYAGQTGDMRTRVVKGHLQTIARLQSQQEDDLVLIETNQEDEEADENANVSHVEDTSASKKQKKKSKYSYRRMATYNAIDALRITDSTFLAEHIILMAVVLTLCESFVVLSLALIHIVATSRLESLKKLTDSKTTGNSKSWVYGSQVLLEKCVSAMPDILPYSDSYNAPVEQLNSTIPICESLRINFWRPKDVMALETNLVMLDNEVYDLREFYVQTLKDIKERHSPAAIAQWVYRNRDKRIVPVNYFTPEDDETLRTRFKDIFDGPGPMQKMPAGIYTGLFRQLSAGQLPFYIMQRCKELGILDDGSSMPGFEDAEGKNMRLPCHELIRYSNANADERDLFCYASSIRSLYQVLVDIFAAAFKDSKVNLGTQSRDAIVGLLRRKIVDLHPENFMDPFFAQRIVLEFARNRNITLPRGRATRSGTAVLFSKFELEQMLTWLQKPEDMGNISTPTDFYTRMAQHLERTGHMLRKWERVQYFLKTRLKAKVLSVKQLRGSRRASPPPWTLTELQTYSQPLLAVVRPAIDEAGLNLDDLYLLRNQTTGPLRDWGYSECLTARRVLYTYIVEQAMDGPRYTSINSGSKAIAKALADALLQDFPQGYYDGKNWDDQACATKLGVWVKPRSTSLATLADVNIETHNSWVEGNGWLTKTVQQHLFDEFAAKLAQGKMDLAEGVNWLLNLEWEVDSGADQVVKKSQKAQSGPCAVSQSANKGNAIDDGDAISVSSDSDDQPRRALKRRRQSTGKENLPLLGEKRGVKPQGERRAMAKTPRKVLSDKSSNIEPAT